MIVANIFFSECLVVLSSSDGSRTENAIQIMGVWLLLDPFSNSIEHISMDFDTLVPQGWVVEYSKDIIHHLINQYSWMLPRIKNTTKTHYLWNFRDTGGLELLTVPRIAKSLLQPFLQLRSTCSKNGL
jgi:hypothetical protein